MKGIKKWKIHKIFQEERNKDKSMICYIGCCKEKQKKSIYKARLVARGFKEIEKDSIREDSPT